MPSIIRKSARRARALLATSVIAFLATTPQAGLAQVETLH